MKRGFSDFSLNVIAGVITLGILALSAYTIWSDRQETWHEAEQSSRNLQTAVARDLGGNIGLLDLALQKLMRDLSDPNLQPLSPAIRHRILFDRALPASYMRSLLVLSQAGDVIADAQGVLPRSANFSDQDYFKAHRERADLGLYMSKPYKSRLRNGDYSITISIRISHPDGRFAGVVVSAISPSKISDLFKDLDLGFDGAINLFRDDGVLLMRKPFSEDLLGRDMSAYPNAARIIREGSGSFEGTSALDNVRRIYTFGRVEGLPLILSVSLSSNEVLAGWKRKALVQGFVTAVLCASVLSVTFLFQRELKHRTKAETKLRRIARTDDLTGLPNRRAFRESFEREWRHSIRSGAPISLLFVDGDFFKAYNDHYGHGAGDDLLRMIAHALDANIRRPRDTAARYGGEEFIVLLPETDEAGARMIAENIRHAVMALGVAHARSPFGVVTVSIGVASARPTHGCRGAGLVENADIAVYRAKSAGRNCVNVGPQTEVVQDQSLVSATRA
jgi:diguanylate cyclase (GGDEF)-like protein